MSPREALRLLQGEIVQVVGCTEPAAIGYALRTLARHLPQRPTPGTFRAELRLSSDTFRNASTAVVPRLKTRGIRAAAAAGLVSRADGLNVFADFDLRRARAFLKNPVWLNVVPVRRRGLFVQVQIPGLRTGVTLAAATTASKSSSCSVPTARRAKSPCLRRRRSPTCSNWLAPAIRSSKASPAISSTAKCRPKQAIRRKPKLPGASPAAWRAMPIPS